MSLVSEQKIEIVVSDEGIGFDPRQLDKQLSEASGIGLSNIEDFAYHLSKEQILLESSW